MTQETAAGTPMSGKILNNYFRTLINLFFKILPLWESGEVSLDIYMRSLQAELIGCHAFVAAVHDDAMLLTLTSILQYLIDHPECDQRFVRREVFRAISICNKLQAKYTAETEAEQ